MLLSATLLAGWLFSDMLYGRAWRWDHKAVFSFLSWLVFAALLLGRTTLRLAGRNAVRILYAAPHCSCWRMSAHASCLK